VLASPEIESEPLAEAFTCETYQPFDPLVPLTFTFEMGGVGSYFQVVLPDAVSPEAAVTVYEAVPPDAGGRFHAQDESGQ
jgi:hypothetical protein